MKVIYSIFSIICFGTCFGQTTYVPDDVFEAFIEFYIPAANNGVPNDNQVLTAALQDPSNIFATNLMLNYSGLSMISPTSSIQDLTGIEDFTNLQTLEVEQQGVTKIDLSNLPNNGNGIVITINNCNLLTELIFPENNIGNFGITGCPLLTSIQFQNSNIITGNFIVNGNNSLVQLDFSSISGVNGVLAISTNSAFNRLNLANGYCTSWLSVSILANPNLYCVQVDDPTYSDIAWNWQNKSLHDLYNPNTPNPYSYSTNCNYSSSIIENHNLNLKNLPPLLNSIKLELKEEAHVLRIHDLAGNLIRESHVSGSTTIYRDDLISGIYLIEISSKHEVYSGKVMVK